MLILWQNMSKEKFPTISIATIIKNEGKQMESFLFHLVDFADEIIIADTGSFDKGPEITRKFISRGHNNIKFFEYEFVGGFHYGKAKNFSIAKATKDYILILDADERLSEEFKENIRQFLNGEKPKVVSLIRKDEALPHFIDARQVRIIKNGLNIFYGTDEKNKLHEQLVHNFEVKHFNPPVWHCQRENHWLHQPHRKIVSIIGVDVERTPKTKSFFGHLLRGMWIFQYKFKRIYFKQKVYKDGWLGFKYALVKAFCDFLVQVFVGFKPKEGYKYWEDPKHKVLGID